MPRATTIQRFRAGSPLLQEVTARRLNELVDAVNTLLGMTGGPGVKVSITQGGATIGLDLQMILGNAVDARISAVSGGAGPGIASTFTYSVIAFGRPELPEYTAMTPALGRPVQSADATTQIYPAAVGDRCRLFLEPDGDGTTTPKLWIGTEVLALEDCAAAAVAQAQSLSTTGIASAIITDRQGRALSDRGGNVLADRRINPAQAIEFLHCALTDRAGTVLVDRAGRVILDRTASADAIAFWDAVLVDRTGSVMSDREGHVITDRSVAGI